MSKKPKQQISSSRRVKTNSQQSDPTNSMHPAWSFEKIDIEGLFAFDLTREDINLEFLLDKLINYSSMTWQEISSQTHDNSKSKHHKLDNLDRLSQAARECIHKKKLDSETDTFFSFALDNIKRLIGIRNGAIFQVVWYDANHEFCPSEKKHT